MHAEFRGDGGKTRGKFIQRQGKTLQVPLHPHQEQLQFGILMLVRVQDVRIVREQKIGDGRHQAFLIRAGDEQDGSMFHLQRLVVPSMAPV